MDLKLSVLVLELILLFIYFVFFIVHTIKEQYDSIASIKVRLIIGSILLVIFFLQLTLDIILKKSVFIDILGLGIWIRYTIRDFLSLKEAKSKQNGLGIYIILGTDAESEEITEEDAVTEVSTENNNK